MGLLKFFLIAAFIVLIIFLINGLTPNDFPSGLNLSVSENLSANIGVFVLDADKNVITSIDENEFFFLQQRGLAQGTIYGFRVINLHGEVLKPVFETFTARTLDWVEQNNYYLNIMPGNQTIELLIIKDNEGIVVAKTNLLVLSIESIILNRCGNLTDEPAVDADGWSRESKIGKCAANAGVEIGKTSACDKLFKLFNDTGVGYGECIMNYANITGDVSVCDLAGMPKSIGFCKATVTGDYAECQKTVCDISCNFESLEVQQDRCILWYALADRNMSLCNEIKGSDFNLKELCLNMTLGN